MVRATVLLPVRNGGRWLGETIQSLENQTFKDFELLVIDDDIRSLILQRTDAGSIRAHAMTKGFKTLRMDGAEKIFNGFTSVEEILRVTLEVSDANME